MRNLMLRHKLYKLCSTCRAVILDQLVYPFSLLKMFLVVTLSVAFTILN